MIVKCITKENILNHIRNNSSKGVLHEKNGEEKLWWRRRDYLLQNYFINQLNKIQLQKTTDYFKYSLPDSRDMTILQDNKFFPDKAKEHLNHNLITQNRKMNQKIMPVVLYNSYRNSVRNHNG